MLSCGVVAVPEIYASLHPARPPFLEMVENEEVELELLDENCGVRELIPAPINDVDFTIPPTRKKAQEQRSLYLWVVLPTPPSVRYINEYDERATTELREKVHHTNLTGGDNACAGGEMWFADSKTIYLTGSSGRYRIRNVEQLNDAAHIFVRAGYKVGHLGFNNQGKPRKAYREGEVCWIMPN